MTFLYSSSIFGRDIQNNRIVSQFTSSRTRQNNGKNFFDFRRIQRFKILELFPLVVIAMIISAGLAIASISL